MEPKDPEKAKYQAMAASMSALLRSPEWDSYRRLVEDAENGLLKRLLDGGKEEYDFNKGQIEGLKLCFYLPQQIIDRTAQL